MASARAMSAFNLPCAIILIALMKGLAVLGDSAQPGDFIVTMARDSSQTITQLTVLSPSGEVRLTSKFPRSLPGDFGQPGQTAVSPDAKYAFTPYVGAAKQGQWDGILVTPLTDDEQARVVFLHVKKECKYMGNAPIAAGPVSNDGEYVIYVGQQCRKFCSRDPAGFYFTSKVLKVGYRPSSDQLSVSDEPAFTFGSGNCTRNYASFGSLRVVDGELFGLMFESARTQSIKLLRLGDSDVQASLDGFAYCNDWSFTIASANSFYGTCLIQSDYEDTDQIPTLVKVTGTSYVKGPAPPVTANDDANRYQPIYDTVATQPTSRSVYTFLEGAQVDSAVLYRLDKSEFSQPPKAVLELNPSEIASSGTTMRVGQLLLVP